MPPKPRRHLVHNFIGAPNRKSSEVAHITPASTPLSILLLYFAEIVTLLVLEMNRYYHQLLDNFENRPPPPDVTEAEMFSFLALTLQMGHTVQDRLEDYWTKMEQLRTPFYGQMLARARYCHILWKIRDLFEIIRTNFSKFYNLSEHLVVDEVIVKFKGRVLFKQYILKKRKRFSIKMFKLCDYTGYT